MGALGNFDADHDDEVLTGNHRAGFLVDAAETLFANTGADALGDGRARLDAAWRELMFAEVSDSTSWNPWRGEVDYSLNHASEARRVSAVVIRDQLAALGWAAAAVDPAAGTASEASPPAPRSAHARHHAARHRHGGRARARRDDDLVAALAQAVYVLDLTLSAPSPAPAKRDDAPTTVTFPSTIGSIRYTPAMTDRVTDLA